MRDEVRNPIVSYTKCLVESIKSTGDCKEDFKQVVRLLEDREYRSEARHAERYVKKHIST